MKKVRIICSVCETEVGSIKKQEFSNKDLKGYSEMFICDCGGSCYPTTPTTVFGDDLLISKKS